MKNIKKMLSKEYIKKYFSNKSLLKIIFSLFSINSYKSFIINLNIFILFCFSLIYYFKSLKGCELEEQECLTIYGFEYFTNLFFEALKSSILMIIIIFIIIHNYSSKFNFIYIIPTYLFLFLKYNGSDLNEHGLYNSLGFLFIIIIGLSVLEFIYYVNYFYKKKKLLQVSLMIGSLIILCLLFARRRVNSCINWNKGLGDSTINNSKLKNKCEIIQPKICNINVFKGLLDFNFFNKKCKSTKSEYDKFIKYINKEYQSFSDFSFPITTNFKFPESAILPEIQEKIFRSISNDLNNKEITLHFNEKKEGEIKININRNKTLIEERRKIKSELKFNNILMIFIDSLSRQEFFRSFKKTSSLLNKLYNKNEEEKKLKISSYQFLKYHSFNGFTEINIIPMFYNNELNNNKDGKSIIKSLKEKGFITCQTGNQCVKELYDIEKNSSLKYENYDYENYALFCDPNYFFPVNYFSPLHGPYSSFKKCLYGKETFEYVFQYGKQFWDVYQEEKKFLRLSFIDAHEGTLELAKYLDIPLFNFLNDFLYHYFDEKTSIFFLSDHGNSMAGLYFALKFKDFIIERALPFLFLILPHVDNDNSLYNKTALIINEQRFITPFDIYFTINDIIGLEKGLGNKQSLFLEINGLERNCNSFYFTDPQFCVCKNIF